MANEFLLNLRAARGNNQNNVSRRLPTRGDMQKQRQTDVDPNSFINFLRMSLGIRKAPAREKQLNIEDVPPQNMDKNSPEYDQSFALEEMLDEMMANDGTLKLENDLDKYNAAINGTFAVPYGHSEFENAYGILNNYDKLNKLLDDYDAIDTWAKKRKFLENSYKNFDDKNEDINKWFNRLYGYTQQAQNFGEWDTKNVSNVMRQINENVKRNLIRKF